MADHTHEHTHSHEHGHAHAHDHVHSHDHHNHEGDTYFIDQLCMVGLSGAFGMICLCLWFLQTKMLNDMLGAQFHLYVLISGFVLVALAGVRGAILWRQSRDPAFLHKHDHDHPHEHKHEHAIQEKSPLHLGVQPLPMNPPASACGHEHPPGEKCAHEAHGQHAHDHHHHDHDAADHDHGWAPWRYVVILVPIILFLLGLPNKGRSIAAVKDMAGLETPTDKAMREIGFGDYPISGKRPASGEAYPLDELDVNARLALLRTIGFGNDPLFQVAHLGVAYLHPPEDTGKGKYVEYKFLESLAGVPDRRAEWKGKVVEVRGQYAPYQDSQQIFMLARYKISCCANDAVQLNVPMISREAVSYKQGDWLKVTGKVDFREGRNGSFYTVLLISKAANVVPCDPDNNPYIQ